MTYKEEKVGFALIDNDGTYKIDHMYYDGLNGTMVISEKECYDDLDADFAHSLTPDEKRVMFGEYFGEQERRYGLKAKLVKMTITIEELE